MKYLFRIFLLIMIVSFPGCKETVTSYEETGKNARIYPEYEDTYIPYNIAPFNFQIREDAGKFLVRITADQDSFVVATKKNLSIPLKKWRNLLEANKGKEIRIKIFAEKNKNWEKYNDIVFHIAEEPIDPYIAYRLIEPGYAAWNQMGLYQRCLENFEETPTLLNTMTEKNCMNCHTFHKNNPDRFVFHLRGPLAGTILAKDGEVKKLNTKAPWMTKAGVYPRWHPDGRYIAFSTNNTTQKFHSINPNKVEVYDSESDIVMYDTENDRIFTSDILSSKGSFETFPEWSPDGRYLYFCSAPEAKMPDNYEALLYDLVRVAFDPSTGKFANQVDTLVNSAQWNKSVSMPRISPDGKYLIFCLSNYGTFPIWHRENDLYLLNLQSGEINPMADVNSTESDSYHSWSTNGRWLLFSSRRMDGNYTRLYISYFDSSGKGHKPILLPQKTPDYYDFLVKSYNVPDFITGKLKISPDELAETARTEAIIPQN